MTYKKVNAITKEERERLLDLIKNFKTLHSKHKNDVLITFIFDRNKITGYKDSPIDCGPDVFLQLFKERIVL